jgi:hypothetical protein
MSALHALGIPADALTVIDTAVYIGLFGFPPSTANVYLGLPATATEDQRRDEMGIVALRAFRDIEETLTIAIAMSPRPIVLESIAKTAFNTAIGIAKGHMERGLGFWDLLTANEAS